MTADPTDARTAMALDRVAEGADEIERIIAEMREDIKRAREQRERGE